MAIDTKGAAKDLQQFGGFLAPFLNQPAMEELFRLMLRNPHLAPELLSHLKAQQGVRPLSEPLLPEPQSLKAA